jgi:hypothetical protein
LVEAAEVAPALRLKEVEAAEVLGIRTTIA